MRRWRASLTRLLETLLRGLERLREAIVPQLPNRDRFLIVLFLVAVGFGVLGFQASRSAVITENFGSNFLDNLYRTLQLFSFNYEVEEAWKPESTWLLLARYIAAFLTTYAVITIFARRLIERTWFWIQRERREHHVILGFGVVGRAFARELRHRRKPVTAIDTQFDDADRAFARDHGILLINGDLSDPEALSRAQIGGARRIIVACGNDLINVEIGTTAAAVVETWLVNHGMVEKGGAGRNLARRFGCNIQGEPVVKVHLASTRLLADLAEGTDIGSARGGFESFSLKADAGRALLAKGRLPMRARDCGQSRVHLVIVGLGDLGEAILISALPAAIAAGLGPPKLTVIDRSAEDVRIRLSALRPRLFDGSIPEDARPSLTFVTLDIAAVSFDRDESIVRVDLGDDPPTAWVFCCGQDELNLAAGRRLELAMHQRRRRPASIFIRRWSGRAPEELVGSSDPLRLTNFFGDIASTVQKSEVLDENAFLLPKVLHDAYRGGVTAAGSPIDIDQFRQSWNRLPENIREANRSTARHIAQKLIDLGFLWRGMDSGCLPTLSAETAGACNALIDAAGEDGSSLVPAAPHQAPARDIILRTEHSRWLVDRAIAGWMAGPCDDRGIPRRDNQRRLHNNIRCFDDLDAQTQAGYARPLAAAIRMLESADVNLDAQRRKVVEIRLCSADMLEIDSHDTEFAGVSELIIRVSETCAIVAEPVRKRLRGIVADWAGQCAACRLLVLLEGPVESALLNDDDKNSLATMEVLRELRAFLVSEIVYDVARLYR
ncbi:NAD-binding protein [Ensifer sp. NBAIM29]|nr:NAD-binding protein [Ensifer sp. NBAIM29]